MTDTSDDDRGNFTDGGDVESDDGLHEDQRRLQELLRGAVGVALAGDGNHRYRRGFRVTLHEDVVDLPRTWKKPILSDLNFATRWPML